MSAAYVNSTYAESGRSLGYYDEKVVASDGTLGADMTETQKTNYKMVDTSSYPFGLWKSGFPYTDYQYYSDMNVLTNNTSIRHNSSNGYYVRVASRTISGSPSSGNLSFMVRKMAYDGNVNHAEGGIYYQNDGSTQDSSSSGGVRPIITLKSNLKITGGSGTASDPYTISY
jgi:hypothetical protein